MLTGVSVSELIVVAPGRVVDVTTRDITTGTAVSVAAGGAIVFDTSFVGVEGVSA